MRLKVLFVMALLIAGIPAVAPIFAQEGHPLTGSWAGEWGKEGEHIRMVVQWDSKERDKTGEIVMDKETKKEKIAKDKAGKPVFAVSGMFLGPNTSLVTMTLDSAKWMVRIETDYVDDNGKVSHVVADGKLDSIGSYTRTITGTWTQGTVKGDFKLKRD